MMVMTRDEVKKKLEELKKEKNLTKFEQKFKELIEEVGADLVHWSDLKPLLKESFEKIAKVFEKYREELDKIHKKQTEFETRFKKIWKKLLEMRID